MNQSLKIIFLSLVIVIGVTSCDKYLEENPDNRVELDTPEKAAQLLTNAYSGAGYNFTEWMGDNVAYTLNTTKLQNQNQSYTWEDVTSIDQDSPSNFWTATYDAISHSNQVLAVIDNLDGDQDRKDAAKGETLLTRAYGHFMLVNMFAKHYDSKTASSDPGVPYVEEPETVFIKKYTRNTVKEVYDKVEKDFLAGLELVDASFYANSGKYHFTKNAGYALASRFYLFKKDYANCIKYSSMMLDPNPDIFIKDIPALLKQKINVDDYLRLYHASGDNSNLLLIRQVTNFHVTSYGYWPSVAIYQGLGQNIYGFNDSRLEGALVAGDGVSLPKFEFLFQRSSLTSNVGLNYTIFLGFRGEEVLLNRAESYLYSSQLNQALADLQVLATKRYNNTSGDKPVLTTEALQAYGAGSDEDNALNYLLSERKKEFMHEGLEWFDLKRYQILVKHTLSDGSLITLKATDKRKVLQIPQAAIDVGGLEANPR